VLANAGRGDWILCQVTSKPYGDPRAIPLGDDDFSEGSLKVRSFVRPGKLFTASATLMVADVGTLNEGALGRIVGGVIAILRGGERETTA
jgi:mRNA interferase MazF